MIRKSLIVLGVLAAIGFGWWMLGGDSAPTQTLTGPDASAEASAPTPSPTTPTTAPSTAPKATDDEHPTSPVEPDEKTTATATNPLRCSNESWRGAVGPLGGKELVVNVEGLAQIPASVTALFVGGAVTCVDQTVNLAGKPLSVTDLVKAKGFTDALRDSRSRTVELADGRKVDIGNPLAAYYTADRAHAPVATK